jgi:hypothetical protein
MPGFNRGAKDLAGSADMYFGSFDSGASRPFRVEHTIHERIQASLKKITTSDHHPVSVGMSREYAAQ